MRKIIVLLIAALLVLSCSSAGKKIELGMVHKKIQVNKSTMDDVRELLGEPQMKNYDLQNNVEIWHYAHVKKNITAMGVLGHTVGLGSEWQSRTEVADFYFKDGVVIDIRSTSSDTTQFHQY